MTTSNDTTFTSTGNQIITDAYSHIRVKQNGQNITAPDRAFAENLLNGLLKSWQRDGLHLWKETEGAVFLEKGRRTYTLGNQNTLVLTPGDDAIAGNIVHATKEDWIPTTTTAAQTAGNNTVVIDSLTAYSGETLDTQGTLNVGVKNVNGDLEWFTTTSIVTLTVTLSANLAFDVDSGASVFIYRTEMDKPLKLMRENIRLWQEANYELPLNLLAFTDYNLLPVKNETGTTVQAYYQPNIDNGTLTIWPTADNVSNVVLFRYQAEFDIFDGTRTQDLPNEWIRPLTWALAAELGPSKGVPLPRQQQLDSRAYSLKQEVLEWDQDESSLFIQPRTWG